MPKWEPNEFDIMSLAEKLTAFEGRLNSVVMSENKLRFHLCVCDLGPTFTSGNACSFHHIFGVRFHLCVASPL